MNSAPTAAEMWDLPGCKLKVNNFHGGTSVPRKKNLPFDKPMRIKMDPLEEKNQPIMRKPNTHLSNMTLTECRNIQRCQKDVND